MNQQNLAAHSDQRVGVFIDTQNLYHSAKSIHRSNVNYEELIDQAVHGRKLVRAFAYVIKSEENSEEKFFEAIQEIGIEIRVKDLQVFHTGAKKADWDVGIAVDIIRLTEKLDVVVLASGDGDFIEVIRYCKSRGVRVEVMAFEKTTNSKVLEEVDHFVDLGDSKSDFLISGRRKKTLHYASPEAAGYKNPELDYAPTPVVQQPIKVQPEYIEAKPNVVGHGTVSNPYTASSNLSQVNRFAQNKSKPVNQRIFSSGHAARKIKPVVGIPAKSNNYNKALPRTLVNDQTKNPTTRANAFGNAPKPAVRKKFGF